MNLMICDDQKNELEIMKQIVSEYAAAHLELSLAIKCFTNSFDMLDEIEKKRRSRYCFAGYLYARRFGYGNRTGNSKHT